MSFRIHFSDDYVVERADYIFSDLHREGDGESITDGEMSAMTLVGHTPDVLVYRDDQSYVLVGYVYGPWAVRPTEDDLLRQL